MKTAVVVSTLRIVCIVGFVAPLVCSAAGIEKMIFEEQRIEGKIRRPQLVLIKAEQRPVFEPMVMESFGRSADVVKNVDPAVVEKNPYKGSFLFNEKVIANYQP